MVRPRKDQQIDIRGRAVEVATRLLEQRGFQDLTLQQIATEVGCRAPALYNHFRNKSDLLRAVHDAGFERMHREKLATASRSAATSFDRLRAGGLAYMRFALENPALYTLMFAPSREAVTGVEQNPFKTDIGMRSLDVLRTSIVACQADGYLQGQEPEDVAFALWSSVHGAASLILQNRVPTPSAHSMSYDRMAEQVVDTMMFFVANSKTTRARRATSEPAATPANPRAGGRSRRT
jgi:AcrR family transcriptional regulator